MDTIGERIRFLRNKDGLSMDQLADRIKLPIIKSGEELSTTKSVTSATISNAENNKHSPSLELIIALSRYFDVTLDWLVLGIGDGQRDKKGKDLVVEYLLKQERIKAREEYMGKAKQFISEEAEKYFAIKFDEYLEILEKDKIVQQKEQEQ
ncbi:helix-turn-helix domain-containing protein [Paenibacillus illinoisensis]|uniref:HTH cro/C1-type domain-containing protein n=1 Tax=Paenibacillus illinoisensis TaxID=59845 RepID=A0A2W0CE41_9BACL|nr:helix-turn-helix transcriptional regulator [Paenibacillus illinoisensis]PYY28372.1 Uncharacterized protein PIL02S_03528 [Paenibacillus illinoisensis]